MDVLWLWGYIKLTRFQSITSVTSNANITLYICARCNQSFKLFSSGASKAGTNSSKMPRLLQVIRALKEIVLEVAAAAEGYVIHNVDKPLFPLLHFKHVPISFYSSLFRVRHFALMSRNNLCREFIIIL